ncbi:N-acetylneuraminate synthase family protein [Vreelandella rituensis]|uniref:N-acetylneuraminate synthase family protein n=1 Tax=Vreelandella rituensis TaxID=2282306 RepID=UPI001F2B5BB9|nr:N-acetylneuraminate synthase family protein [Halomonas rituensis]
MPVSTEDYNLRTIRDMIERFGLVTDLSDHTLDNTTAIASVVLGASIPWIATAAAPMTASRWSLRISLLCVATAKPLGRHWSKSTTAENPVRRAMPSSGARFTL